ncbi:MAG TPA: GtrA family protein [Chloroflexota bacterium]|jgi:putative flippase GtrA
MRRVVSWVALGVVAAGVELVLLRVLYEGLGVPLVVATAVAAEALILGKFLVADRWVFNHRTPSWDRLLRYHGASAGAFVVYWLAINGLVELLAIAYPIAFVLGTGAAFAWSLVTNFLWVWAQPGTARRDAGP